MSKIRHVEPFWNWVVKNPTALDVGTVLTALVLAVATAVDRWAASGWMFWLALVCACVTCLFGLSKVWAAWKHKQPDAVHELAGCLEVLHSILLGTASKGTAPKLRMTIHKPIKNGTELLQVTDYVGGEPHPGSAGRVFRLVGVVGEAYRRKEFATNRRTSTDLEEYRRLLVDRYGFTRSEAVSVSPAAMSWFAAPILSEANEIEGVLYLDSVLPDFFDDERRWPLVLDAIPGIARFINFIHSSR